ncbi:MAG TPA: hypothetical protein VG826_29080 [Pirellulales bacterium]|nr:hypothetical protein [Pirellulales bacterium]
MPRRLGLTRSRESAKWNETGWQRSYLAGQPTAVLRAAKDVQPVLFRAFASARERKQAAVPGDGC